MVRLPNKPLLQICIGLAIVMLMSNIGALIDAILHPEIPYFDKEHLIVGGVTAFVITVLLGLIAGYVRYLEQSRDEIETLVAKRTKELHESRERLAHILSSNPAVIYTAKPDSDYGATYISDNLTAQLGYNPGEFLEDPSFRASHIHPEDVQRVLEGLSELLEEGHHIHEYRFRHKDGSYRWMQDELRLIRDESGAPVEIMGLWIDITERKQAEEALRESQERLQLALGGADLGLWDWDLRTGEATRNERTAAIYGYPSAVMDHSLEMWESVIHPADKPEVLDKFNKHLEGSTPFYEAEYRLVTRSGEAKWVLARGKVSERDGDGKPLRVSGTLLDITDRKQAEEELRIRDHAIKRSINAIHFANPDGTTIFANDSFLKMWGFQGIDDALGIHVSELADEKKEFLRVFAEFQEKGFYVGEITARRRDGTSFEAQISASSLLDDSGKLVCFMASFLDITDRKQAEEALREAHDNLERKVQERTVELKTVNADLLREIAERKGKEERLSRISSLVSDIAYSCIKQPSGAYLIDWLTGGAKRLTGYSVDDLTSLGCWRSLVVDDDLPVFDNYVIGVAPGTTGSCELRLRHKTGGIVWIDSWAECVVAPESLDSLRLYGGLVDITDRKKAEEALRISEMQLSNAVTMAHLGHWGYDFNKDLFTFSDHFYKIFRTTAEQVGGYTMSSADYARRFVHPDDISVVGNEIRKSIEATDPHFSRELEHRILYADGEIGYVTVRFSIVKDDLGSTVKAYGVNQDITERKRGEELQLQTTRFKAVADLAGGVAHNFNNLLQIVIGNLELALMDLESGNYTDIKDSLEMVLASSKFGAETVRRLQSFAGIRDHSQVPQRGVFDLSTIVRQAIEMSKTWWKAIPEKQGRKVSLDIHLQDGCLVQCEKNELFEVVVNLIKNATEALTQDGAIDAETRVEGDQVILKVRDTGVGISEQNLKRLFNPFFTTKARAGAGLGLASSRKIIDDCGGNILVDSSEGKGTTFTCVLPLIKEEPKPPRTEKTPATVQQLTVLAIDDEEAILDLLKNALSRNNCEVFTALSGEKGLDIFKENPVDLVICDLGMPGMTGWEVGKRIRAICEERGIKKTPFMLLTGWGGQKTEVAKMTVSAVDVVMEKPLNIKNMWEVVRKVVEKSRSRDAEE